MSRSSPLAYLGISYAPTLILRRQIRAEPFACHVRGLRPPARGIQTSGFGLFISGGAEILSCSPFCEIGRAAYTKRYAARPIRNRLPGVWPDPRPGHILKPCDSGNKERPE